MNEYDGTKEEGICIFVYNYTLNVPNKQSTRNILDGSKKANGYKYKHQITDAHTDSILIFVWIIL